MKFLIKIIFLFILSGYCIAQPANISFQHFNTENGLSSNLVRHIIQDKYGFLWIGTTDGLNRFDGKNFTVYRNFKDDPTSISNNIINGLCVDSSGKVWVATNGGLCYYDYTDDIFHHIIIDKDNADPADPKRIYKVAIDKNNRTWYITKTMLHRINVDNSITTYRVKSDELGEINSLTIDSENRIWIGTNKGKLLLFNKLTKVFKSFTVFTPDSSNKKALPVAVVKIFQVEKDKLLAGTWYSGLQQINVSLDDVQLSAYEDMNISDDRKWIITSIAKSNDASGHFWISHYGCGLSMLDINSGNFILHKRHDPSDAKSLCHDFVNVVFTDNSGTLWVGTDEGLDKYDELSNRFSIRLISDFNKAGTVRRFPSEIIENINDSTHQSLWISVSGAGLFNYSRLDGSVKSFHHSTNRNSLLSDYVYSLYMTADGLLWIGTLDGVCTYDEKKGVFETIAINNSAEQPKSVGSIIEDRQHRLWFGSLRNGVYCYNRATKKIIHYEHDHNDPQSLAENRVFCITEDHLGRIWAGTQTNGISRLDEETSTWKHFKHKAGTGNTIPENFIYSFLEDENNQLWIATENGLGVMDLKTENVKSYSTADGLCNNDIFSFQKTSNNHLWIATTNGLSDFDLSNKTFRNYYTMDGLPTNSISGAFSSMSDGTIFAGVSGGIFFFNPTEIKSNTKVPEVVITTFSIFDKKYPFSRVGIQIQPIQLNYAQSMITFGFAALNFTNPGNNMYAYKLEGFDKDWIYCGNRTSATYTNLDGGDYVFRVIACNNDGVWNRTGASVNLSVTPPFWKTIWFYAIVVIAIATILLAVYRIRINQIMRLQNIRQRIARDLHDDIGSTLSSISMMSKMATGSSASHDKSAELFSTIGKASSLAMDLMSDIVWSVNPENDKMENIISRMREYASVILDAAGIEFSIEIDEHTRHIVLPMEKRKDFFLVFKEAINNLAKYSKATTAVIRLSENNHNLILLIKDNGKGFNSDLKYSGNGLKNMKARADQLNGKFEINSKINDGTQVVLSIPLVP